MQLLLGVNELFALVRDWSAIAVFLRLVLAAAVGIVVGAEREHKNKIAGVKTHVLVCLGSAMAMIVSEYLMHQFPEARADLNRIGAQVVSGVGFLGVGTIMVTGRDQVQGLSTAAGLWACACIGLAAGAGYVEGTLIAMMFVLFTYVVLSRVDAWVHKNERTIDVYVELEDGYGVRELIQNLRSQSYDYSNLSLLRDGEGRLGGAVALELRRPQENGKDSTIGMLQHFECVAFADEIG